VRAGGAIIIGRGVCEETTLRAPRPVRDLDEFLEFLSCLEAIFGPLESPRVPTTGDRFLL
jgi:hypothetical protein